MDNNHVKVGDIVEIINIGKLYSHYSEMAEIFNIKKWFKGKEPDEDKLYKVIEIKPHLGDSKRGYVDKYVAYIEDVKTGIGYMIDTNGIRVFYNDFLSMDEMII